MLRFIRKTIRCAIISLAIAVVAHAVPAKPEDVRQAKAFLAELPPACGASSMTTAADGTVVIYIKCENSTQAMDGVLHIKNGIVTKIR